MKNAPNDPLAPMMRPFGIRQWLGGYGWFAMGLVAVFLLVFKTGTVGAPAQASGRSLEAFPTGASRLQQGKTTLAEELPKFRGQIALEGELRRLRTELTQARTALGVERERSQVLEDSYRGLDEQFDRFADLVRSSTIEAAHSQVTSAPKPIEAIYVVEDGVPSAAAASSPNSQ